MDATREDRCNWCPDPRYDGEGDVGLCLSSFDVEKAMDVMAFKCEGYVRVEDRVEVVDNGDEEEKVIENIRLEGAGDVVDFSCFSQAWGEFLRYRHNVVDSSAWSC